MYLYFLYVKLKLLELRKVAKKWLSNLHLSLVTFCSKKNHDWGNEIFFWKAEKPFKDCHGLDKCSTPLLKQLTMNAVQLNTAKCSKTIVVQRWMNHNLHCTLPMNTSKIVAVIFCIRSLPSGSYFWMLLKTIPFTELLLQSYLIQTYLWSCSSGKWLPEHEKSQDLY